MRLDREVTRIENEIKKAAKAGNMVGARKMAKELINVKKTQERLMMAKSQTQSVALKSTTMSATHTIAMSMEKATAGMKVANAGNCFSFFKCLYNNISLYIILYI